MDNLIEIQNLSVEFYTERAVTKALNGVNLTIGRGESLGLVGESGAGKTTTALSILQMLSKPIGRLVGGDILYCGSSLRKYRERKMMDIRGNKVSMIFHPLPNLTQSGFFGRGANRYGGAASPAHDQERAKKETQRLLEMVSIPGDRYHDYPVQFSGGMRQRVGIAAGLACSTELLIADEPTTALDVTIQAQVLMLLKDLQLREKTALLMITHNLGIVSELYSILGTVANPQRLPGGCFFHPRCTHCAERCATQQPPQVKISDHHYVSCFNH